MFSQRGYLLNLILSSSDVVRNPVIFYIIVSRIFIILDDYISRIGDLVSGLTNRSNIYHKLSVAQGEPSAIVALYIRVGKVFIVLAFALIKKDSRNVRMPHKTILRDKREQRTHLSLVVDIFRENVFVKRISGRTVNEKEIALFVFSLDLSQKIPARICAGASCRL